MTQTFTFGGSATKVYIQKALPDMSGIAAEGGGGFRSNRALLVCDSNTAPFARKIGPDAPLYVLGAGEDAKNWQSVEAVLKAGKDAGLGRDGVFVGIGGGVVCDMTAFAASVYMRGAGLALVSTTLLGMVDAAVGGKTGFDLFGIKNFVGTFNPAPVVFMPVESLNSLPENEWKSGMAELIKTAILDGSGGFLEEVSSLRNEFSAPDFRNVLVENQAFLDCVGRSVAIKGRIVEADPRETGTQRVLLNLGHTFGHALEAAAGLGSISHGEAVAWGISRACELGKALGVTGAERAEGIAGMLRAFGYETGARHPLMRDKAVFMDALLNDKKKRAGKLAFVVPNQNGAQLVSSDAIETGLLERICGV